MMSNLNNLLDFKPEVRKLIYGVIAALVPLLVAFGAISNEIGQTVLNVSAAILTISGSVLAIKNVPTEK